MRKRPDLYLPDFLAQAREKAIRYVNEQIEDLIFQSIAHAMDGESFLLEDVIGRGQLQVYQGQPGKVFAFDGKPLLWLSDYKFTVEGTTGHIDFNYKKLWEADVEVTTEEDDNNPA